MAIYKDDKTGTYHVSVWLTDPVENKKKKVHKRGFKTKKEAQQWEAKALLEGSPTTSISFWDVFQKYLANNDTSDGTRRKKEMWISMYFADLKDKPIEKIEKAALVTWRNGLKETSLAVRSRNCGLQYVRSVFTFYSSVYGGINKGSVLKNYKMTKSDKKSMEIWTTDEFNLFLSYVKKPIYHAYFSFLFWTGCRRGEGIALTADCFTGNEPYVHIYRSMKHYKQGFQPLKTDSSERTICIDDGLMEELRPFLELASPFVFGGEHPLSVNRIQVYFEKAIKESGVKPIRLHDLRHSHASILLNNGVNVLAVSKRLGHSNVRTTLDTYAHLMKDSEDALMETIKNIKNK